MLNKFFITFACILVTTVSHTADYPVTNLGKLTGYAKQARVTGGGSGKVVTVKDIAMLKYELLGNTPKRLL